MSFAGQSPLSQDFREAAILAKRNCARLFSLVVGTEGACGFLTDIKTRSPLRVFSLDTRCNSEDEESHEGRQVDKRGMT